MSVGNISKEKFTDILNEYLTPSDPVKDERHLYGRTANLREIDTALSARGRQIFIYGERGVGKTSLAYTAAYQHIADGEPPIYIPCSRDTKFYPLIQHLAGRLLGNPFGNVRTITESVGGGAKAGVLGIGFELDGTKQITRQDGTLPEVSDLASAVELIRYAASKGNNARRIVLIDEFDLIGDVTERGRFADFVKQLGDQSIPVQVIFCGIGSSVTDLFEAHNSSVRYLNTIKIDRLDYDARWAIIDNAANAIGVTVPEPMRTRIAIISDGFPHYVHLVCHALFWEMYHDPKPCSVASPEHYRAAIAQAVRSGDLRYQPVYEKATQRSSGDYELALWATAAHYELIRKNADIYAFYSDGLVAAIGGQPLAKDVFFQRLRQLKTQSFGGVLTSRRAGWYQFSESMMRGYVRLRAEEKGVELPHDHTPEPNPKLPTVGAPKLRPIKVLPRARRWR